jgi:hypothetical protein
MSKNNMEKIDLRRIRRLLRETTRLAEHASMTGSLQGGQRIAIRQYNAIRNHLEEEGAIPEGLFQELDEDEATFDELGVVTGMLDGYLEEDLEEGEAFEGREGRAGRREERRHRRFTLGLGHLEGLEELRNLGEAIRECLPELARVKAKRKFGKGCDWDVKVEVQTDDEEESPVRRQEEISAEMQEIAEEFQREDLEFQERLELAKRLAELGREQEEAVRRAAQV